MELVGINQQSGYELTQGISVYALNQVQGQRFEREFTRLKQGIAQNTPSSRLLGLLNEIEHLYRQGNLMFAERKLRAAREMARKEGALPNPINPLSVQENRPIRGSEEENPGTPEDVLPDAPMPKVPEPDAPEPEIPEEVPAGAPSYTPEEFPSEGIKLQENIGKVEWRTRTYKDVSTDIGATFQHATPLNELETRVRVSAHESGHVLRTVAKALVSQRRIEHAYFVLKWKVDYRHHKLYLTGGEARMRVGGKRINLRV